MYDMVDYNMPCPTCGGELRSFQTHDGQYLLGRLDWREVRNFYTSCPGCESWIEFTRKPAASIADYVMVVEPKVEKNNLHHDTGGKMNTNKREQMWQSLSDPEYRHQFVEEEINVGIAFQIRSLRNRQKLTQGDLADKLGVKQPLVSAWENPNYGKYTLGTLKDLAKAFDVGLLVRFVPFNTLVDWIIDLSPDTIAPPSFGKE